jgi:hypothetical protein
MTKLPSPFNKPLPDYARRITRLRRFDANSHEAILTMCWRKGTQSARVLLATLIGYQKSKKLIDAAPVATRDC